MEFIIIFVLIVGSIIVCYLIKSKKRIKMAKEFEFKKFIETADHYIEASNHNDSNKNLYIKDAILMLERALEIFPENTEIFNRINILKNRLD